jgi:hypothetical protein
MPFKPVKFTIDGDIESPKESTYLKTVEAKTSARTRTMLWLVLVLCVGFAGLTSYLYFRNQSLQQRLRQQKKDSNEAIFQSKLDSIQSRNDSLLLANAKLILSNELLVENSGELEGIFFEVHLNLTGDFQIERYREELAELYNMEYYEEEKLILGRFRSYKKALLFENDLRSLGVPEVFLLGRVDGRIMTFKEAMAAYKNENN